MKGLIFTYLLTYGGSVVALFRPFYGLLIYICFAIIRPEALWPWAVPSGSYSSRIIFIALFVGWVFAGFGTWRVGRARLVAASLVLYQLWVVISAIGAPDQAMAWYIAEETAKVVLPVLVGLSLVNSIGQLKQIAWVIAMSHGYLALEFNRGYYDGTNGLFYQGFAGMDEKTVASTMVVAAALSLFLTFNAVRWWAKGLAAASTLLMIHVPLFTMARGAMLGLLAFGLAAFWLIPKKVSHVAVMILVTAIGFGLAGEEVREKFRTSFAEEGERDDSAQSRIELWGQAWETMLSHPITGVGPRHWGSWSMTAYGWPRPKEVHNTWFQAGAELGIPGVSALALFFLVAAFRCLPMARARASSMTKDESDLARMVICGLAGYLVVSQFITIYGIEVPYYVALIGAGLLKLRAVTVPEGVVPTGVYLPARPAVAAGLPLPPASGPARPYASTPTSYGSRNATRRA